MNIEQLKARQLVLRKSRNPLSKVLGTLIAEFEDQLRSGETVSEADIFAKIKKYIERAKENLELSIFQDVHIHLEIEMLEDLLPNQLEEDTLIDLLMSENCSNVGDFMKFLKENYVGQYDARVAAKVAREYL